jgi:hypothetical protein
LSQTTFVHHLDSYKQFVADLVTSITGQIDSQPDADQPEQLVEEPEHLVEVETIPDIVQVVNRVGRPRGPKQTYRPTQIPMDTILEANDTLPAQTQGKKRGRPPKKTTNDDAVEPSTELTADERPRTQKSAKKPKK